MQQTTNRTYKIVALPEELYEGLASKGKLAELPTESSNKFLEEIEESIDKTFAGYEAIYYKNFVSFTRSFLGIKSTDWCDLVATQYKNKNATLPSSDMLNHLLLKLARVEKTSEEAITTPAFKVVVVEPAIIVVVMLEGFKEYHDMGDFTDLYKEILDKSSTIMTYDTVMRSSIGTALVADIEKKSNAN